jgi:DNA-binding NtrC family response regulator
MTSNDSSILLIEDNPSVAMALEIALKVAGFDLDIAAGPEQAMSRLAQRQYRAILLDLNFSPGASDGTEGLACLRRIVRDNPDACVVVLTAHGGIRIAVTAMQEGARDFVVKPWRNADLIEKIESAVARGTSKRLVTPEHSTRNLTTSAILGESQAIERVRELIKRVGPTPADVAISGPGGSGKMLAAMAILAASPLSGKEPAQYDFREPFQPDAFRAIGEVAILKYPNRLEEVTQERLARLLPDCVRCISIVDGVPSLSPALLRRLATAHLRIPPLSERGDDAVVLARHFVDRAAVRFGRRLVILSPEAEAVIRQSTWPDEVRGLALSIERAVLLATSDSIDAAALRPADDRLVELMEPVRGGYHLDEAERIIISAALREHHYNVTHAASALGISRGALYRRMERYGL